MPTTSPTIGVTGTSAHSLSYGAWSDDNNFEVTNGDCKVTITSILNALGTATDYYNVITFNYVLEDDRTGEIASIKPLYSVGGESGAYSEMTEYTGGSSEGKNNLSTSPTGVTHVFEWDTVTNLGIDFKGSVWIKFRAYDRINLIGDYMESGVTNFIVDNAPEAPVILLPVDNFFDKNTTPQIKGTIPDPKSGNSNLHIKIQVATDSSFDSIELTKESAVDQVGWEYSSDGTTWTDLPVSGIPIVATPALIGKYWRYTIQTEDELTIGAKYIRAAAAGILI